MKFSLHHIEPCGNKGEMYDPLSEVCCDGKAQPMYEDEDTTKCCGQISYNGKLQMCCDDRVY